MPPGRRAIPRAPAPRRKRPPLPDRDVDPVLAKAAGDLIELAARIRACEACERSGPARALGTGYPKASVMLVAERPSAADLDAESCFVEEAAALDKAFEALQIPLSWVYGSTSVRCGNAPATTDQVRACASHLLAEVEAIEPRVIVAFGPRSVEAVRALDGRCGLRVPADVPQGSPVMLRPGLSLLATEPLPEGVTSKDAKRRLWRDLRQVPDLIAVAPA